MNGGNGLDLPWITRRFRRKMGYRPNLADPRTFNEKIVWRALNDRNPLLAETTCKLGARRHVERVVGPAYLPELYHETADPVTLPGLDLPAEYVIKPSHMCGRWFIVTPEAPAQWERIVPEARGWLETTYAKRHGLWGYWPIPHRIMVEELLRDARGGPVADYKFHVFHGRVEMILVVPLRSGTKARSYFDADWNMLPFHRGYPSAGALPRPERLNEMVQVAEAIGSAFDFVRVDMYNASRGVTVGELTQYPGRNPFVPARFDRHYGSCWRLPMGVSA